MRRGNERCFYGWNLEYKWERNEKLIRERLIVVSIYLKYLLCVRCVRYCIEYCILFCLICIFIL